MKIERTNPNDYLYVKMLLAGFAGADVSAVAATAPGPLFLLAGSSLACIADKNIPYVVLESTDTVVELFKSLNETPDDLAREVGYPVQTLIIDAADELQRILIREKLKRDNKDDFGPSDWTWLEETMREILHSFRDLPINVIVTCNLAESRDDVLGKINYMLELKGKFALGITELFDLCLLLDRTVRTDMVDGEPQQRLEQRLISMPIDQYPWVKAQIGNLPYALPINLEDDFERIRSLTVGALGTTPEESVAPKEKFENPVKSEQEGIDIAYDCADCSEKYGSADQNELSLIRAGRSLCAECYVIQRKR